MTPTTPRDSLREPESEYFGTQRHANDPETSTLLVLPCVKCGDRHTVDAAAALSEAREQAATEARRELLAKVEERIADIAAAMPWYDDARPDYSDAVAVIRRLIEEQP